MPGVYAKPPKRADFAKEIEYMLCVLKKKEEEKKWGEIMEVCVPMILDEFALERQKAREEAKDAFEKQVLKCREATSQQNSGAKDDAAKTAEGKDTHRDSEEACRRDPENSSKAGETSCEAGDSLLAPSQAGRSILSLAELEARKERDVAEVFFVSGMHAAFCRILRMASREPEMGDVMPIIMEYQRLLLVEIDPYDVDISPLPLLIYFLSERHHFYVDIHWQHHELTIMETFLHALVTVLETLDATSAKTFLARECSVTQSTASSDGSSAEDLAGLRESVSPYSALTDSSEASPSSCKAQLQISPQNNGNGGKDCLAVNPNSSAGASSRADEKCQLCKKPDCGVQSKETYKAVLKLLCRTLFTFPPHRVVSRMAAVFDSSRCRTLVRAMLCTSYFWESSKGLAQIAHTLAAIVVFGLGAPMAAALVPSSLLWVGASNLIRETRCPCASCELQRRLMKACRMRDEVGVQAAAQNKRQIAYCLVRGGAPRLLQQLLFSLAHKQKAGLQGDTDAPLDDIENDTSYIDQALQFTSWVLLLCSWPYEEMHNRESILAFNNATLLDAILACLPATKHEFLSSLTAHQRPGATSLLSATLHLLLRAPLPSRDVFLQRANAVFYPLLVHITDFVAKRDPYGTHVRGLHTALHQKAEKTTDLGFTGELKAQLLLQPQMQETQTDALPLVVPSMRDKPEETLSPSVEVLLLAPLVMGLFQSVLGSDRLLSSTYSPGLLNGDGIASSKTKDVAAAFGPSPFAVESDAAAGKETAASLTVPNSLALVIATASTASSVAPTSTTGLIPEGSANISASLILEQRRHLIVLGTAACQAFVHLYEYLRPLLSQWEGFESQQDFDCTKARPISSKTGLGASNEPTKEGSRSTKIGEMSENTQLAFPEDDSWNSNASFETTKGAPSKESALRVERESAGGSGTCNAASNATRSFGSTGAMRSRPSSLANSTTSRKEALGTMASLTSSTNVFLPCRVCLAPCLTTTAKGFDFRGFYYAVVSCMFTLVGGLCLHSLPQNRWRFAENPAAAAGGTAAIGGLASAARKIIDFQRRELSEGCSYVKNAANLVVTRAEHASAVLLRHQPAPSRTLRLLARTAGESISCTDYPEVVTLPDAEMRFSACK